MKQEISSSSPIAVLGAGSWGTTLALVLHGKGYPVRLWEYRKDAVERMIADRENREFLPGIPLPEDMSIFYEAAPCLEGAGVILLAIPSQFVRGALEKMVDDIPKDAVIVNVAKGVEEGTLKRPSEVVADLLPHSLPDKYAALSGPSHAEEVSRGIPTTVVAASPSLQTAKYVQELFFTPAFRVYAREDLIGVELGAALKNVIAIATGICDGLHFGDNTKGALLTRGLAEMTRLGVKLGGYPQTFSGLSGMGDLITTCMSRHSRNAEGVRTTTSSRELAHRENVPMPITEAVYDVLFENKPPREAVTELMTRELKVED